MPGGDAVSRRQRRLGEAAPAIAERFAATATGATCRICARTFEGKHWRRGVTGHSELSCRATDCGVCGETDVRARHFGEIKHCTNVLVANNTCLTWRKRQCDNTDYFVLGCFVCDWETPRSRPGVRLHAAKEHLATVSHQRQMHGWKILPVQQAARMLRCDEPAEVESSGTASTASDGSPEVPWSETVGANAIRRFLAASSHSKRHIAQLPPHIPTTDDHQRCHQAFTESWSKLRKWACAACGETFASSLEPSRLSLADPGINAALRYPTGTEKERGGRPAIAAHEVESSPYHVTAWEDVVYCLDPEEVVNGNEFMACPPCASALRKGKVRGLSYRGGCDFGRCPEAMSDSRPEERSSIALTLPFTSIRQIRHSKNVASRFSEQTISFPAEKDEMPGLELLSGIAVHKIQLPRQQNSVKISFIGRNTKAFATGGETGDAFRENYKLRTATVGEMLEFLMKHSILYQKYAAVKEPALCARDMEAMVMAHINGADCVDEKEMIATNILATDSNPTTCPARAPNEHYMVLQPPRRKTTTTQDLAEAIQAHQETTANRRREQQQQQQHQPEEEQPEPEAQPPPPQPPPGDATDAAQRSDVTRTTFVGRGATAVNEYTEMLLILAGGMPHLFPCVNDCNKKFLKSTMGLPLVRHLLLQKDTRWAKDGNFQFFHFNIHRRQALARSVQATPRSWQIAAEILEDEQMPAKIAEALKNPEAPHNAAFLKTVSDNIQFVTRKVPYSNGSRKGKIHDLIGTYHFMGLPNFFITFSPLDRDVHLTVQRITGNDPAEFARMMRPECAQERSQTVQNHPAYAAESFWVLVNAVVKDLLGVDMPRAFGATASEPAMFGYAHGLFGVFESQARGSLHTHLLLWGPPMCAYLSQRLESLNGQVYHEVIKFADAVVSSKGPPNVPQEVMEDAAICPTIDPCPTDWSDHEAMKCRDAACAKSLGHTHHPACFKYKAHSQCRYGYPRPAAGSTGLYLFHPAWKHPARIRYADPLTVPAGFFGYRPIDTRPISLLTERDERGTMISDHNVAMQRVLGFNTNVQMLGTLCVAFMAMLYLTKYLTKPITAVEATQAAVMQVQHKAKYASVLKDMPDCDADKKARSNLTVAANRLGNFALGVEEISAQMACAFLLGHPAELQSHSTRPLVVWPLVTLYHRMLDEPAPDTAVERDHISSDEDVEDSNDDLERAAEAAGVEVENMAPVEVDPTGQVKVLNNLAENFLHRGPDLANMCFYMYAALVEMKILTPEEIADYDQGNREQLAKQGHFLFAPTHAFHKYAYQKFKPKPHIPCPVRIPHWSEYKEHTPRDEVGSKYRQRAEQHAAYFGSLFMPISADFRQTVTVKDWKAFLAQLKRHAGDPNSKPTQRVPWPADECIVILGIIESMRFSLHDSSLVDSRSVLGKYRYGNATTRESWLASLSSGDRNRYAEMMRDAQSFTDTEIEEALDKAQQLHAVRLAAMDLEAKAAKQKDHVEKLVRYLSAVPAEFPRLEDLELRRRRVRRSVCVLTCKIPRYKLEGRARIAPWTSVLRRRSTSRSLIVARLALCSTRNKKSSSELMRTRSQTSTRQPLAAMCSCTAARAAASPKSQSV